MRRVSAPRGGGGQDGVERHENEKAQQKALYEPVTGNAVVSKMETEKYGLPIYPTLQIGAIATDFF